MHEAAGALQSVAREGGWKGEAAEKFSEIAEKTHEDLDAAAEKYTDAARALREFASSIGVARTLTGRAVRQAEEADQHGRSTAGNLLEGIAEPTDDQRNDQERRERNHSSAMSDLGAAKRAVDNAMDDLDRAAERAEHAINAASEHFKDTKMDNFRGFVSAAVKVLEVIAIVLLVVIIVVVVIATFGGALGVAAGVVAVAAAIAGPLMTLATAVGAAIMVMKGFQLSQGDTTMGDFLLSVAGVFGGPLVGKIGGKLAAPVLARMTSSAAASVTTRSTAAAAQVAANQRSVAVTAYMLRALDDQGFATVDDAIRVQQASTVADDLLAFNRGIDTVIGSGDDSSSLVVRLVGADDMQRTVAHATYLGRNGATMENMAGLFSGLGVQGLGGVAVENTIRGADLIVFSEHDYSSLNQNWDLDVIDRPTSVVPVGQ